MQAQPQNVFCEVDIISLPEMAGGIFHFCWLLPEIDSYVRSSPPQCKLTPHRGGGGQVKLDPSDSLTIPTALN